MVTLQGVEAGPGPNLEGPDLEAHRPFGRDSVVRRPPRSSRPTSPCRRRPSAPRVDEAPCPPGARVLRVDVHAVRFSFSGLLLGGRGLLPSYES